MSSTAARLDTLGVELLTLIFDSVQDNSPHSIKSIAAVNRYLRSASRLIVHRDKEVTFGHGRNGANEYLQKWLDNGAILRGVPHLTINGRDDIQLHGRDRQHEDPTVAEKLNAVISKWGSLASFIERLGNLKTLVWNYLGPVPLQVIRTLEQYQEGAELKVNHWQRAAVTSDHTDLEEIALANCTALTSITASIWTYGMLEYPDLREAAFCRIVACAPNLKFVSISKGHQGTVRQCSRWEALKKLRSLENMFWTYEKPRSALKTLKFDDYNLMQDKLRDWSRFVDMSKLESLTCDRIHSHECFFKFASETLMNLKHVSLEFSYPDNDQIRPAAEEYFAACSPLQSLSLWSWSQIVPLSIILDRHGPTLRLLHLHGERYADEYRDQTRSLSIQEIGMIKDQCPDLQDLNLDLQKNTIGLAALQLCFCLGFQFFYPPGTNLQDIDNNIFNIEQEPLPPLIDYQVKPYMMEAWKIVFGNKTNGKRTLNVKFKGRVVNSDTFPGSWQVRPAERDDQVGFCTVHRIRAQKL